jgi:hypothetical protein
LSGDGGSGRDRRLYLKKAGMGRNIDGTVGDGGSESEETNGVSGDKGGEGVEAIFEVI